MSNWYSVSGLFRWRYKDSDETALFEERIILIQADSFDEALDKAELESNEYCEEDPKANYIIESLSKFKAYDIMDTKLESGMEVFSRRRESPLSSDSYLKHYYPETITKNG